MKINVAQQIKEPIGSQRSYFIDETTDDDCLVQGRIQLVRTNRSILVTGELTVENTAICSRCTEEFANQMEFNIEEEYLLPKHTIVSDTDDLRDEVGVFTIDENNILDLNEAIRQYTQINMPMKPICSENCAGLCASCGCNLNYQSCNCTPISSDSPWAPLRSLLQEEQAKGTTRKG